MTNPRDAFETYIVEHFGACIWEGPKTGRYYTGCTEAQEEEAFANVEVRADNRRIEREESAKSVAASEAADASRLARHYAEQAANAPARITEIARIQRENVLSFEAAFDACG